MEETVPRASIYVRERDAALVGFLAGRAPRIRSIAAMRLMEPDKVADFVTGFTAEWNRLVAEASVGTDAKRRELETVRRKLIGLIDAIAEGSKLRYVLRQARKLAAEDKKVLLWSSFVRNVEYMADRLSDLGAVYIHGRVEAGDEEDDETREGKIRLFHDDPNCKVMIANPAAASEGISLHRVCHHAIYLDRTFNAAHFLQSQDRIHRFGLLRDQETIIEIVECRGTVDETAHQRLRNKINAMSDALEDASLRVDASAQVPSLGSLEGGQPQARGGPARRARVARAERLGRGPLGIVRGALPRLRACLRSGGRPAIAKGSSWTASGNSASMDRSPSLRCSTPRSWCGRKSLNLSTWRAPRSSSTGASSG